MLGKKILAVIVAVLVLLKLAILLIAREQWLGMAQAAVTHTSVVMVAYLILLAIIGYFMFATIDLIDIAVVMLFTGLLMGLNLIPYAASLQTMTQEIAAAGLGRAWLALIIWIAIALAVLYRVFAREGK